MSTKKGGGSTRNGRDTAVDLSPKIGFGPETIDDYAASILSAINGAKENEYYELTC